jgi:dTDP-4-amino-4,6-dideoxy-D-galactose acyltransferase
VDGWAREHDVDCLYYLAPDEPGEAGAAEDGGFRLVDVRVELARETAGDDAGAVRASRQDDEPVLRRIARTNHPITRFYADPRFPDERCDDLYETWIARSLAGWADAVLVADRAGRPAGYVSCHADADAGRGSIGLIGVDPAARGLGLGRGLVLGAVAWCRERGLREVTVVTQARNVPALRTFERCGFLTTDVGLWFHKWFDQ